jgi:GntR family transcriptional repressor for pyruvate dehydrogenase complex
MVSGHAVTEEIQMDLRPIKSRKIYEEIVEQIKRLMADGDLKPGDRLLSERELAERLQVSRASVREALRALEAMGFLEIKTGGGAFVKETCTNDIILPLAMFISIEKGSFNEIYEIRKIFETAAARLAACRATPIDLAKMEENLKKLEEGIDNFDSEKGEDSDTAFHFAIAEATQNSWLLRLLHTISDSFHKTVSAARKQLYLTAGNAQVLVMQHRRIYEAIRDANPHLAEKAMLDHLTFAEAAMAKNLNIENQLSKEALN